MGKIGDDLFGQAIRELLERHGAGLSHGLITAMGEASSYTIILSAPDLDRMFIHAPGCNDSFSAADLDRSMLEEARLMHFGYPPVMARLYHQPDELAKLFRRAKQAGVTTSLDLTLPNPDGPAARADWRAILAGALPFVDLFLPSIEQLLLLMRRATFDAIAARDGSMADHVTAELLDDLAEEVIGLGAKILGLKLDHRGLYLRTADAGTITRMGRAGPNDTDMWANRELWAPCYATSVVGTTGAGDATIAGLLMALLRGMSPAAALSAACAVGACSVEAPDATGGVRRWDDTERRIHAGWPQLPLDPGGVGWRWDGSQSLWAGPHDRGSLKKQRPGGEEATASGR
jgi:sugar/nucleoside kinase (ribokinase family)